MFEKIAKLVEFGNGGDLVHFSAHCQSSGYGSPEKPHAAQESEWCVIPDGTPAIDKRPCFATEIGYAWVFNGPMVNVDLPDDEVDRCPEPSEVLRAGVAENDYGRLLARHGRHKSKSSKPGPLDCVCIRTYIDGWKAIGARIGHYENGVIVWDK